LAVGQFDIGGCVRTSFENDWSRNSERFRETARILSDSAGTESDGYSST
jgi:hypothetical protein